MAACLGTEHASDQGEGGLFARRVDRFISTGCFVCTKPRRRSRKGWLRWRMQRRRSGAGGSWACLKMGNRLQTGAGKIGHGIARTESHSGACSVEIIESQGFTISWLNRGRSCRVHREVDDWGLPIGNVGLRALIRGLSRAGSEVSPLLTVRLIII